MNSFIRKEFENSWAYCPVYYQDLNQLNHKFKFQNWTINLLSSNEQFFYILSEPLVSPIVCLHYWVYYLYLCYYTSYNQPQREKNTSLFSRQKGSYKMHEILFMTNRKKTQLYWFHIKSTTLVWLWKEGNAYHILFTWLKNYHYDLELRMKFQKECLYLFIYSFIYVLKTHIFFFINLALQDCLNHFCPIWLHNLIFARNSLGYLLVV